MYKNGTMVEIERLGRELDVTATSKRKIISAIESQIKGGSISEQEVDKAFKEVQDYLRLQKENEERRLESERQIAAAKLAFEKEKLEKEMEREKEKLALERQKLTLDAEIEKERILANERIQLAQANAQNGGTVLQGDRTHDSNGQNQNRFDMSRYMQPFKENSEDVLLFLTTFKRICVQMQFPEETYSVRLLSLLSGTAREVVTRLCDDDFKDFEKVKKQLLQRYQLTAEALHLKFRSVSKTNKQSYSDFAYTLNTYFSEWVRTAKCDKDFDKLVQLMCVEQFLEKVPKELKMWLVDKGNLNSVVEVATMADEWTARRVGSQQNCQTNESIVSGVAANNNSDSGQRPYYKRYNNGYSRNGSYNGNYEGNASNWSGNRPSQDQTNGSEGNVGDNQQGDRNGSGSNNGGYRDSQESKKNSFEKRGACYECGDASHLIKIALKQTVKVDL